MNFYNEFDSETAAWLRELRKQNLLPKGIVDERDITELRAEELKRFDQCHFFAGIGGWPFALKLADWPNGRSVWTGSPPCQPFSAAGKRAGAADERHLWPAFYGLIRDARPAVIFGEQVASSDGRAWLAAVRTDLDEMGYAFGAADLCAASVGAPHIRQRLFWVALSESIELDGIGASWGGRGKSADNCNARRMEFFDSERCRETGTAESGRGIGGSGADGGLAHCGRERLERRAQQSAREKCATSERSGSVDWSRVQYIHCLDEKVRPIPTEPELFPLADGFPKRVGLLRGYGNAIVPQVAAQFIRAVMDYLE